MLAGLGFAAIAVLLALILTRRASPLVALVAVPLVAAIAAGHAAGAGGFAIDGIRQTAPVVATFVFAILFFGVMTDAGLLDPVVDAVIRGVGTHPTRIVVGSALLAAVVHLDGSGAVTFLVAIPALRPLYDRLGMDRRVLACVVALGAGVMNIVPWGGPTLRAAAALQVPVSEVFLPLMPVMGVGLAFTFGAAVWLGQREARRLGDVSVAVSASGDAADRLSDQDRALRRPGRRWLNAVVTLAVLVSMVAGVVEPAVAFMVGTVLALVINYPDVAMQRDRVDAHARAALMMATILLAAGVFTGVMKGTGMLNAMAISSVGFVPPALAPHIPAVLGVLSMPLSLLFDPDSFYFGMLPVIAEVAGTFGVPATAIGQAALLGQMTVGFPVSPLTPTTFLLIGLAGIDLAAHQRFTIPFLFACSVIMTIACVVLGVFAA